MDEKLNDLIADVKEIKEAIIGSVDNNEKIGIKGQIALIKQSLGRAWWAISLIIIAILGSAARIIWSKL